MQGPLPDIAPLGEVGCIFVSGGLSFTGSSSTGTVHRTSTAMSRRNIIDDARDLRARQTAAEALLWSVLRGKQVSGLKFRRQHPEPPWIIDFACLSEKLAVEIDGGYHDHQSAKDAARTTFLKHWGWNVVRFTNEEVTQDIEAVAMAIAQSVGLAYEFQRRKGGISSVVDRQRVARDAEARAANRKEPPA